MFCHDVLLLSADDRGRVNKPRLGRHFGEVQEALQAQYGASAAFNVAIAGVDVVAETLQSTDQGGVDVAFNCAGTQATMDTATLAVRRRGMAAQGGGSRQYVSESNRF